MFSFFHPALSNILKYSSEHDELTVFSLSVVDMEKLSMPEKDVRNIYEAQQNTERSLIEFFLNDPLRYQLKHNHALRPQHILKLLLRASL